MKLFTRTFSLLTIASLALFSTNCKDDPAAKTPEEIEFDKLAQTWNIVSATLDGVTRTSEFTNFDLILSGSFDAASPDGPYDYDVSGSRPTPNPWPASGTWTFAGTPSTDAGLIARSDGTAITYVISGNQLTLTFNFTGTGYPGARTSQVQGDWVFVLSL